MRTNLFKINLSLGEQYPDFEFIQPKSKKRKTKIAIQLIMMPAYYWFKQIIAIVILF